MAQNKIQCSFGWECNNGCLYCATHGKPCNLTITTKEIPKVLDKIGRTKDVEVEISGGEPTLNPVMFYFLERLSTNLPLVEYTLLTNGRNFSKPALAARMSELNPHNIMVPVHADTPQLHDFITQSAGSFDETMLGIKNLYEYGLPVNLKVVVNKLNYECLPHLIDMLAQKFPACRGIITNMVVLNSGKALENKELVGVRIKDTVPHIEKMIDAGKKYGFKVWVYSVPPCMLCDAYKKYAETNRHPALIRKNDHGKIMRVKAATQAAEKCRGCPYVSSCTGTWKDYFDIYGTDEINPFK